MMEQKNNPGAGAATRTSTTSRIVPINALQSVLPNAIAQGLKATGLPLPPALQNMIAKKIGSYFAQQVDDVAQQSADEPADTLPQKIKTLQLVIQSSTQGGIDKASLAAVAEIMPLLANLSSVFDDETAAPLQVRPEFLAGLGEGQGEETGKETSEENEAAERPTQPGAPATQDTADEASRADIEQGIEHGKENLPAWDLSPKQKEAFAQQQLEEQLGAPTTGTPTTGQETAQKTAEPGAGETGTGQPGAGAPARPSGTPGAASAGTPQAGPQAPEGGAPGQGPGQGPGEAPGHTPGGASEQDMANQLAQTRGQDGRRQGATAGGAKTPGAGGQSTAGKPKSAKDLGRDLGEQLKKNIKTGSFSTFIFCLALAMVKDIIEWAAIFYADPGLTGSALSVFIGAALTTLFLSEGVWFKRFLVKRFFGRAIIALVAEFIPGFNLFPAFTIGVLLLKRKVDQALKKQKKALSQIDKLSKAKKLGKHVRDKFAELKAIADE